MSNEFKAGDFTSGKMGDIFKACFLRGGAQINHKQFGSAFLIPEETIRDIVLIILFKRKDFKRYATGICHMDSDLSDFAKLNPENQKHYIEDYFEDECDNWYQVLTMI
tara:strand:+ start:1853 stop:2176 length:324 start_codon:yes stop_codon:yes gene_type:complete